MSEQWKDKIAAMDDEALSNLERTITAERRKRVEHKVNRAINPQLEKRVVNTQIQHARNLRAHALRSRADYAESLKHILELQRLNYLAGTPQCSVFVKDDSSCECQVCVAGIITCNADLHCRFEKLPYSVRWAIEKLQEVDRQIAAIDAVLADLGA